MDDKPAWVTEQERQAIFENMQRASVRAQGIALFWLYLVSLVALFTLNLWIAALGVIPLSRVLWVRWRDRWLRA